MKIRLVAAALWLETKLEQFIGRWRMRMRFNILNYTTLACISALALCGCSGDPADDDTSPSPTAPPNVTATPGELTPSPTPTANPPSPTPFPSTLDADEDGFADADDCNDHDDTIYPGAVELCDQKDNDCDTDIDEGVKSTYYRDEDGDSFGIESVSTEACSAPSGYSAQAGDCDDGDSKVNPGATDIIGDEFDDDCDGIDHVVKIAGVGFYNGDDIPATEALVFAPKRMVVSPSGTLIIADYGNFRVRQIDATGTISTIAGTGVQGSSGDGGLATAARVHPHGLAYDDAGNLYISEPNFGRIRMVDVEGIIHTVAGTGINGFSGDGGPASLAQLNFPLGLAWSADGLYIADNDNDRIRRIDLQGKITTVAGDGVCQIYGDGGLATAASLCQPSDVDFDLGGNLHIADHNNYRIRKVDTEGIIRTVAGKGTNGSTEDGIPATQALLKYPGGIAFDAAGNLYIALESAAKVRRVDSDGIITTVAGTGESGYSGDGEPATSAMLYFPYDLVVDSAGDLIIIDTYQSVLVSNRVRRVDSDGIISTVAGRDAGGQSADGGPAQETLFNFPSSILQAPDSTFLFADTRNNRLRILTPDGIVNNLAGTGDSGFSGDGGAATEAQLSVPQGMFLDRSGDLYFCDAGSRVRKITKAGIISTVAGTGAKGFNGDGIPATEAKLNNPWSVTVDQDGRLYIADNTNRRIRRVEADGTISTIAGTGVNDSTGDGGPAVLASIQGAKHLAFDPFGSLYFTEFERIRKITHDGIISTVAGGGSTDPFETGPAIDAELGGPIVFVFDPEGGLIFSDQDGAMRRIDASGTLSTIMGFRSYGTGIQEGPAMDMSLFSPNGITFDTRGDLIIADTFNQRILRLSP